MQHEFSHLTITSISLALYLCFVFRSKWSIFNNILIYTKMNISCSSFFLYFEERKKESDICS